MAQLTTVLSGRLYRALATWPDRAGWMWAAAAGAVTLAAMAVVGFAGGLYALHPTLSHGLAARLVTVMVVPAFGEELPFRGVMMPGRDEARSPWLGLAISTPIFTLWHVLEAKTWLPSAAEMFLRPDFLVCATLLGLGCGLVRWRTGSLWPAVGLHWLAVTVWQTWLGGFTL